MLSDITAICPSCQDAVVAVPVEKRPDPVFGHVQVFDARSLLALGARTGRRCRTLQADGAWLVLDRPARREHARPSTPDPAPPTRRTPCPST